MCVHYIFGTETTVQPACFPDNYHIHLRINHAKTDGVKKKITIFADVREGYQSIFYSSYEKHRAHNTVYHPRDR